VGNNADSHELLSVVTAIHHQGVGETLNDWALCFTESLLCVTAGGMGDVDWGADLDIIAVVVLAAFSSSSSLPPNSNSLYIRVEELGFLTSKKYRESRHLRMTFTQ
jgi:hypothetical protein